MNRSLFTIIILLVTIVLIAVLAIPSYRDFQRFGFEAKNKNKEFQQAQEYYSGILEISEQLENYNEDILKVNSNFLSNGGLPDLINFLQENSSDNGLILKNISSISIIPTTEVKKNESLEEADSGLKKVVFTLTLVGSYSCFKDFLFDLERSSRLMEVESINFSASEGTEDNCLFNLKIRTYSY